MKIITSVVLALITSFALGIGVFFLTYLIAITLSPPHFLIDGKQYSTMPLGQVYISIIVAVGIGIAALILLYKYFKKKIY